MGEIPFSITNKTNGKLTRLPFERIKERILGKKYSLSLVFIGNTRSQTLNRKYRKKNTPANVLAFPLSKTSGEIFINLNRAERESKQFDMSKRVFVGYLFIHALLHLKGRRHGSKMKSEERKMRTVFNL
jgi:probable rRNA maturation factor|tara:strand:+ start:7764 stop:8150 length:387 start_codon:yes stop_codon:yes gene_type:complete